MKNAENFCLRMTKMIEQLRGQMLYASAFSREVNNLFSGQLPPFVILCVVTKTGG